MPHVLSAQAVEEIRRLFREEQAKYRNDPPLRQRWHRGAGGSDVILFEIDEAETTASVEATVIAAPCGGSPGIGAAVTVEGDWNARRIEFAAFSAVP